MRAFVTGATGFVGSNLVRKLLQYGHEVRTLVREHSSLDNLNGLDIELVSGDLSDKNTLAEVLLGCEIVYHVAALYSEKEEDAMAMYKTNVEGTMNMLEAARRAGVKRFVHTSTIGTIGRPEENVLPDEDEPFNLWKSCSHYVRTKYLAERGALISNGYGLEVVVVNPCAPVGPFDIQPSPTGRKILCYLSGVMPSYPKGGINFIHVQDVANGHIFAAYRGKAGQRYILGNQNLSLKDFLEIMERVSGRPQPRSARFGLRAALRARLHQSNSQSSGPPALTADCSRAVRELGLTYIPLEQAFEEAIRWFEEKGYLREEANQLV